MLTLLLSTALVVLDTTAALLDACAMRLDRAARAVHRARWARRGIIALVLVAVASMSFAATLVLDHERVTPYCLAIIRHPDVCRATASGEACEACVTAVCMRCGDGAACMAVIGTCGGFWEPKEDDGAL